MSNNLVSIILSVYNGEKYLDDSISSVLSQSYKHFELIIINDGSSDNSISIITEWSKKDKRIVVVDKKNTGLTSSLNIGLEKSNGKYIARIDADDVWLSSKLESQVDFMEKHPEIVLLGTGTNFINEDGEVLNQNEVKQPTTDLELRKIYLYKNPFVHSSVLFRTSTMISLGPYNVNYKYAQDYEFWYRMMKVGHIAILPEVLISRRLTDNMIGVKKNRQQRYYGFKTKLKIFVTTSPSIKGLKHLSKTFIASIIPNSLANKLKVIIQ